MMADVVVIGGNVGMAGIGGCADFLVHENKPEEAATNKAILKYLFIIVIKWKYFSYFLISKSAFCTP